MMKELLSEAQQLQPELVSVRRTIHQHPETGFDVVQTKAIVKKKLTEMGYIPQDMGKAGLVAEIGTPGKTILLRADMDALNMQEQAEVDYCSQIPGKMHGCGHDMHTAMLLGAAKLLKAHEQELKGTVRLEFQPAEAPAIGDISGGRRRHFLHILRTVSHHRKRKRRSRFYAA